MKILHVRWTEPDPVLSNHPASLSISTVFISLTTSLVTMESSPTTALISLILRGELETDMMKAGEMKLAVWGERKESWAGVRADHWLPLKNLTARGARPSMAGGGMEESWGADSVLASQPRLTKSDTFQSAGDP